MDSNKQPENQKTSDKPTSEQTTEDESTLPKQSIISPMRYLWLVVSVLVGVFMVSPTGPIGMLIAGAFTGGVYALIFIFPKISSSSKAKTSIESNTVTSNSAELSSSKPVEKQRQTSAPIKMIKLATIAFVGFIVVILIIVIGGIYWLENAPVSDEPGRSQEEQLSNIEFPEGYETDVSFVKGSGGFDTNAPSRAELSVDYISNDITFEEYRDTVLNSFMDEGYTLVEDYDNLNKFEPGYDNPSAYKLAFGFELENPGTPCDTLKINGNTTIDYYTQRKVKVDVITDEVEIDPKGYRLIFRCW